MTATRDNVRILIAEDSPTQAEKLKYTLEQHGYEVVVAQHGVHALSLLAEHKPVLVISDIVMPEMDGYELCRRIRAEKSTAHLPVVLLTSLADTKDVLESLACGANSFITKPYSQDYLLAQVAQTLSGSQQQGIPGPWEGGAVEWKEKRQAVSPEHQRAINLLISTYEAAIQRNRELSRTQDELQSMNERLEDLVAQRTADLSGEIAVRRQADENLRVAALYTRSLIEASLDPLVTINPLGKITDVNKAAELVTGVPRERLIGCDFSDYVTEPEKARAGFQKAFTEGVVHDFPLAIRHVSGRATDVLYNASVYRNESGEVQGVFAAARNITERKLAEDKIRCQLEELQRWQSVMLGREDRNISLKVEVNELLRRLGEPVRYPSQEGAEASSPGAGSAPQKCDP